MLLLALLLVGFATAVQPCSERRREPERMVTTADLLKLAPMMPYEHLVDTLGLPFALDIPDRLSVYRGTGLTPADVPAAADVASQPVTLLSYVPWIVSKHCPHTLVLVRLEHGIVTEVMVTANVTESDEGEAVYGFSATTPLFGTEATLKRALGR
jgi:hypothetical protein